MSINHSDASQAEANSFNPVNPVVLTDEEKERFWSKVEKTEGCWLWTAAITTTGYGAFRFRGKRHTAHRLSFSLEHGQPTGVICHKCDNPRCVRPDHLWQGTQIDNIRDMHQKGRFRNIGSRHGMAILDEAKVRAIRIHCGSGKTDTEVAALYGVCRETIGMIRRGKIWKLA